MTRVEFVERVLLVSVYLGELVIYLLQFCFRLLVVGLQVFFVSEVLLYFALIILTLRLEFVYLFMPLY